MERRVIDEVERVLRSQCAALDPSSVPLPEAPELYLALARCQKLLDGAMTRLYVRVDEARPGEREGKRSTEDWDAANNGTSPGASREKRETSRRLREQPDLDAALAKGELSGAQANAISGAAGADPSAEKRLVGAAGTKSLKDLRTDCDRVRANAHPDAAARRAAIQRDRFWRSWLDGEGAWNARARMLPEHGAEIEALLAPYAHAAFEAARRQARHESPDAYKADGLLGMARSTKAANRTPARAPEPTPETSTGPVPKGASVVDTKLFVHVDLASLLEGRTSSGSICHIDRIGPVDLEFVRSILGDAFVAILLTKPDGTIHDVVHLGRRANALQRSVKEAQGIHCETPGCDRTHGLELHHIEAWTDSGITQVDLLVWLCSTHHDLITYHGHQITGPPGARVWLVPDDRRSADPDAA